MSVSTTQLELLGVVAAYADQLLAADELAAHDSMTVAQALEALYVSREWVEEFLIVKPRPQRLSNAWREDSRHRFSQWLMWKLQQQGRTPLINRRTYQLLDAMEVARQIPNLNQVQIREERKIRPLNWLKSNGYKDRIPDVWRLAVAHAGAADNVTSVHVRTALQQWKHESLGASGVRRAIKASRAKTLRGRALAEIRALIELGTPEAQEEYEALLLDVKTLIEEKRRGALRVVSG